MDHFQTSIQFLQDSIKLFECERDRVTCNEMKLKIDQILEIKACTLKTLITRCGQGKSKTTLGQFIWPSMHLLILKILQEVYQPLESSHKNRLPTRTCMKTSLSRQPLHVTFSFNVKG